MKTATKVRDLPRGIFGAQLALYSLSEPLDGYSFVIISTNTDMVTAPRSRIYGATFDGQFVDWGELDGSYGSGPDAVATLNRAGYEVV